MKELLERLDGLWEKLPLNEEWEVLPSARGSLVHVETSVTHMPVCSVPKARMAEADLMAALKNSYPQLRAALSQQQEMREALEGLLDRYTALVNCGDCGNWDPETEPPVIAARRALALKEE